jgi:hypothetical protein
MDKKDSEEVFKNHEQISTDKETVLKNPRFRTANAHRCNDHLEDVFQNFGDENVSWGTWRKSVGVFVSCLSSRRGQEPPRTRQEDDDIY